MPRYKQQIKKGGPWRALPAWARITIIVVSALVFITLATFFTKRIIGHVAPVYGGTVSDELMSKRQLISKINSLQTTLQSYDAEISNVSQLQSENASLKEELGRVPAPAGVLATVLTLPNRSFYDTMNIDAGSAQGIKNGMTVYAFGSVALGTISSVNTETSTVYLYSAPGQQTSGTAVTSSVAVTLIGRGAGEYEVDLPRDVPFTVGDAIAAQSTAPATLATIEKIITDPRDPFQRLLAKAPVNLQALKWVIVR